MLVFTFIITIFIVLFAIVASRGGQVFNQQSFGQAQLVAETVAQQINSAVNSGSGYSANITLSSNYGVNNYNISVLQNGEVIVYVTQASQKIQAVAYSQAKSLLVSSSISTGYMTLQNYMGLICIDVQCPSSAGTAASITLSSQAAHAARFNGVSSYINTGATNIPTSSNAVSVFGWIYYTGNSLSNNQYTIYSYGSTSPSEQVSLNVYDGYLYLGEYNTAGFLSGLQVKPNIWYFVGYTYSAGAAQATLYLNGQSELGSVSAFDSLMPTYNKSVIGARSQVVSSYFQGDIANLQVYNTQLSAPQEYSLYYEGISGAPIAPANAVAWWQLNGDTNDYSGNNNTGAPYSVVFPTVAQVSAKVTDQFGNPVNSMLVGFTTTNATLTKNAFASNYTNQNGMAYAFLTQNLTNAQAAVTATAFAGGVGEEKNLSIWWPLGNNAYDISGNNNTGTTTNVLWVVKAPQQVKYYVPINLTNSQNSSTQHGFQQMLTVNSVAYNSVESNSLQNVDFFYANGTVIPSWLESGNSITNTNTIYWLKIAPIIAQGSKLTVYMGFASNTVNLMNNKITGEAPSLSANYGQYDDGASIFSFYDNFAGATLSSKWVTAASGGTATINNGLSLTVPETVGDYVYVASASAIASQPIIAEAFMNGNSINVGGYRLGFGLVPSQTYLLASGVSQDHVSWQGTELATTEILGSVQTGTAYVNLDGVNPVDSNYHIWGLEWLSGEAGYWYNGYPAPATTTSDVPTDTTYLTLSYDAYTNIGGIPTAMEYYWVRTRAYPPNGIMPTASFGTLYPAPQSLSGYGAVFNGKSSYITANAPGVNTIPNGYNTASFWMYWSGANGLSSNGMIPFSLSSTDFLWLYKNCFGFSAGSSDLYGISSNSLANGWVYVTAELYNGAYTGSDNLYINGVQRGLSQCTGSAGSVTVANSIGLGYEPGSSTNYFFNGSIYNLQVYNVPLSATQAYQLYAGSIPPSSSILVPLGILHYP